MTRISEVMTRGAQRMRPDDSVMMAAQAMQQADVGALPVCEGDRLLGIVTDRDIVVRGLASGLAPDAPVRQVMSSDVCTCSEDDDIDQVAQTMEDAQVRRIPVLDQAQHLVGMVSLGDLSTKGDLRLAGDTLSQVSEPSSPAQSTGGSSAGAQAASDGASGGSADGAGAASDGLGASPRGGMSSSDGTGASSAGSDGGSASAAAGDEAGSDLLEASGEGMDSPDGSASPRGASGAASSASNGAGV